MVEAPDAMVSAVRGSGVAKNLQGRMCDWVGSVLGEVSVWFEAPGIAVAEGRRIGLYLMDLWPSSGTRGSKTPPLQFGVRYLVTAWGPETAQMHGDLCELAFSAMDLPEFEVDFEPLSPATWTAFGIPPRPSFSVRMPLRRIRPQRLASMVRSPLVLAPSLMTPLDGIVLGPLDTPVVSARVELLKFGLATQSDAHGCFGFAGVPAGQTLHLKVLARGIEKEFVAKAPGLPGQPLQLRIDLP